MVLGVKLTSFYLVFTYRPGDQLIEINDQKLEGLTVERVYEILDKTPPGKVYIKVLQGDTSEKLPLQLNDALSKLQSERQILDKKMANKPKGTGMASRLSVSSGDSGGELGFFLLLISVFIISGQRGKRV